MPSNAPPLTFPRAWIADAGDLLDALPPGARLEWIEQRWTLAPPVRWCRFSFSVPTYDDALEQMKGLWRRSSSGGRTVHLRLGSDAHVGRIQLACEPDEAARGLQELASRVSAYRPLLALARDRGSEPRMVYHTELLQDPQLPDPRPLVERAGLLVVGNLTVHDVESCLTEHGCTRLDDGQLATAKGGARLQVWDQVLGLDEGVHITLNPDNLPGRPR